MSEPAHAEAARVDASGLRRKIVVSGGIKLASAAIGLGATILAARLLGAQGYGYYAFALTIATLLVIPAQMGWPTLLTREIARSRLDERWGKVRGILFASTTSSLLASLVLSLLAVAIALLWPSPQGQEFRMVQLLAAGSIPFLALASLRSAALRGMGHVLSGQSVDALVRPAIFVAFMATAFALGRSLDAAAAMAGQVFAVIASFIAGAFLLRHYLPPDARTSPREFDLPAWRSSLWPLAFVSSAQVLSSQTDVLLVGSLAPAHDFANYKVASVLATQVSFANWLVNAVFAPHLVQLHHRGQFEELRALMRRGARYSLAIAIPAAIVIIAFGKPLLAWALGEEFAGAYVPAAILAAGQLFSVSAGPVGLLLGMTGHERDVAKVLAISAVVGAVLIVLLARPWGLAGAALATSLSLVLARVMLFRCARRNIAAFQAA